MLNVGQIYKELETGWLYIITYVTEYSTHLLYMNGYTIYLPITRTEDITENDTLIAEYPTWQEAVNSKEFRDE